MSPFDKTLIGLAVGFSAAVCLAYWFPGSNDAAFKVIEIGAASAIGFFLGKKTGADT
jgi:hypothetical protein